MSDQLEAGMLAMTREALAYAVLLSPDPIDQAAALIGAATVIIERSAGKDAAFTALMALLGPTLESWAVADGDRRAPTRQG